MEKRAARVSEAQWRILLDFLEHNSNLVRARGYNNSARGRAESLRLWQEVAKILNAEGSGTTKSPKDWSVYVSNYKSKLKKIVADINADVAGTGGGPPRGSSLSDIENRFLAILGQGFGQSAPQDLQQPSTSAVPQTHDVAPEQLIQYEVIEGECVQLLDINRSRSPVSVEQPSHTTPVNPTAPSLPRKTRHMRLHSRRLPPRGEAQRILAQVELQRAAADAASASARALEQIARNIGWLADSAERYLSHIGAP